LTIQKEPDTRIMWGPGLKLRNRGSGAGLVRTGPGLKSALSSRFMRTEHARERRNRLEDARWKKR
jgi:hypothetical protein